MPAFAAMIIHTAMPVWNKYKYSLKNTYTKLKNCYHTMLTNSCMEEDTNENKQVDRLSQFMIMNY